MAMRNFFRWFSGRTERQPISQEELGLLARQLGFQEKDARAFLRRLSVDQRASTLADLRQLEEAKKQLSRSPGGGIPFTKEEMEEFIRMGDGDPKRPGD